jgi:PAS domain S-box-containing protein
MTLDDLDGAIEQDELTACFQPIVELSSGSLTGFEVLARWNQPDGGLVLPSNLISMAEGAGLIGEVMRHVLKKAFAAATILPDDLSLHVNVSPLQMEDLSLPEQIRDAGDQAGFPLNRLTVEITESALLNNLDRARTIAGNLKSEGCKLSLDDFGTGYSSLGHLQSLPFDELKIDGSFVQSMTDARSNRKIVAAIIGLGHSLDLSTIGEGVETEQQAEMLKRLGCSQGQGWLYGRPVPGVELANAVAALSFQSKPGDVPECGGEWPVSSLEAMPSLRLSQLQAIYDGAPVGLCFLDRNLRYLSINRRLAAMNGHTVEEHLGKTVQEMIPASYSVLAPYLLRALRGEPITGLEVSRPGNNAGDPKWTALLSYQPALDESSEVIGVSVAVVDTTEFNRTRDALRVQDLTSFDEQPHPYFN